MKRLIPILICAALFLQGCAKDDTTASINGGVRILTATIDSPQTRASFGEELAGKMPVVWTKGDQIAAYDQGVKYVYELQGEGGAATGMFKIVGQNAPASLSEVYYPAAALNAQTGLVEGPEEQEYTPASFDPAACEMRSQVKDAVAGAFMAQGAVVCLQMTGNDQKVAKITLTATPEAMPGEDNPAPGTVTTLNCPGIALSQTAVQFYIVVPAGKNILTFSITTKDGEVMTKTTAQTKTLLPGNVHRFPELEFLFAADPVVTITGKYTIKTKAALSTLTITGNATYKERPVEGTFAWKAPTTTYAAVGEYDAEWIFTPTDAKRYNTAEGTVKVKAVSLIDNGTDKFTVDEENW